VNCKFRLALAARESIVAHARAARPAECCGLLVGANGRIDEAIPARNVADLLRSANLATTYVIDPGDHVTARREARRRGLAVVGFYHSHPASRAWPSPTDIAEASYEDALYVIVSLQHDLVDVRGFRIAKGRVVEVSLETELEQD
jgi:proteasome lid subunit RPN8/RPN11